MFRRIFSFFLCFVLVYGICNAQNTANVQYTFSDFTSVPQAYSLVSMTPLFPYGVNGGVIVGAPTRTLPTGGAGSVTFSNVLMGQSYLVQLRNQDPRQAITAFTNSFPISLAGTNTINGSQWVFYTFIANGFSNTNSYSAGIGTYFNFNAGVYSINVSNQTFLTNFFTTIVYSNPSAFMTPQQTTDLINLLATTNGINSSTATNIAQGVYSNNPSSYATLTQVSATNTANLVITTNLIVAATNNLNISLLGSIAATNSANLAITTNLVNGATNNPSFTRFGSNVVTSVSATGSGTTSVSTTNASGIGVAITVASQTNGFTTLARTNPADVVYQYQLAGLTNGFANTNSLASYATTNYVNSINASNLVTTTNLVIASTNGLATLAQVAATNSANLVITTNLINNATNGLATLAQVSSTNTANLVITTNLINGATNGLAALSQVASTNTANLVITTNLINGATNGLASLAQVSATNTANLVITTNLIQTATNNLNTSLLASIATTNTAGLAITTNIVNATSNSIISYVTNTFVNMNSGVATNLQIWSRLRFGNWTNFNLTTNLVGSYGANIASCNSTWENVSSTSWTNIFFPGWNIQKTGGNYYMQSNGVSYYQNTSLEGNWTVVMPLGTLPNPYSAFGSYWNMNGTKMIGNVYITGQISSTNLTAQILAISSTNASGGFTNAGGVTQGWLTNQSFSLTGSNIIAAIASQYITNGATATNVFLSAGDASVHILTNSPSFWTLTVPTQTPYTYYNTNIAAGLLVTNGTRVGIGTNIPASGSGTTYTFYNTNAALGFYTNGATVGLGTNVPSSGVVSNSYTFFNTNLPAGILLTNGSNVAIGTNNNFGQYVIITNGFASNLTITNPATLYNQSNTVESIIGPIAASTFAYFIKNPVSGLFQSGTNYAYYSAANSNWIFGAFNGNMAPGASVAYTTNTPATPVSGSYWPLYTNGVAWFINSAPNGYTNFSYFYSSNNAIALTADNYASLNDSGGLTINQKPPAKPAFVSLIHISSFSTTGNYAYYSNNAYFNFYLGKSNLSYYVPASSNWFFLSPTDPNPSAVFYTTNTPSVPTNGSVYIVYSNGVPDAQSGLTNFATFLSASATAAISPITFTVNPNSYNSPINTNSSELGINSGASLSGNIAAPSSYITSMYSASIANRGNIDSHTYTIDGFPVNLPTQTIGSLFCTNCTGIASNYNGIYYYSTAGNYWSNSVTGWLMFPQGNTNSAVSNICYFGGFMTTNYAANYAAIPTFTINGSSLLGTWTPAPQPGVGGLPYYGAALVSVLTSTNNPFNGNFAVTNGSITASNLLAASNAVFAVFGSNNIAVVPYTNNGFGQPSYLVYQVNTNAGSGGNGGTNNVVYTIQNTNPISTFYQLIGASNSPSGTGFTNVFVSLGSNNPAITFTATNSVDRTNLHSRAITFGFPLFGNATGLTNFTQLYAAQNNWAASNYFASGISFLDGIYANGNKYLSALGTLYNIGGFASGIAAKETDGTWNWGSTGHKFADASGNLFDNNGSSGSFKIFDGATDDFGGGGLRLTNLVNSSTVSSTNNTLVIVKTKNSDGSTNYDASVNIATNILYAPTQSVQFWGDSLTLGNLSSTPYGTVPATFPQNFYEMTGIPIVNNGVSGDTSSQVLTRFRAAAVNTYSMPCVYWAGINNVSQNAQILSDIGAMVATNLLYNNTNYLVMSIISDTNQGVGTATYSNTMVINSNLSAIYAPDHWCDVRGYLIAKDRANFTNDAFYWSPTNDVIGPALRYSDGRHLNNLGYQFTAESILNYSRFLDFNKPVSKGFIMAHLMDNPQQIGFPSPITVQNVNQLYIGNATSYMYMQAGTGGGAGYAVVTGSGFYPSGVNTDFGFSSLPFRSAFFNGIYSTGIIQATNSANGFRGNGMNITNVSSTNINFGVFPIQTNFVSGFLYTNVYGRPIQVQANVGLSAAAVTGDAGMALWIIAGAGVGTTNYDSIQTTALSIAMAYTNQLSGFVATNAAFTFTNISAGAGNTATLIGGQIY